MKTLVAIAAAVALLAAESVALASGPFGPPDPAAGEDQLWSGAGFFSYSSKWKPERAIFSNVSVDQNQGYLELMDTGITLTERGGALLRLGAADVEDRREFDDGYKPFITAGVKSVWYGNREAFFQLGTVLLLSYYGTYEAETTLPSGDHAKATIRTQWNAKLGIAAQLNPAEWVSFYGGPMIVYSRANVSRESGGFTDDTMFKEKDPAGVFAGAQVSLSERWSVFAEGQYRGSFSGGASIAYWFDR